MGSGKKSDEKAFHHHNCWHGSMRLRQLSNQLRTRHGRCRAVGALSVKVRNHAHCFIRLHWFCMTACIGFFLFPTYPLLLQRSTCAGFLVRRERSSGDYGGLNCASEAFPLWSISPVFSMAVPSRFRRRPGIVIMDGSWSKT